MKHECTPTVEYQDEHIVPVALPLNIKLFSKVDRYVVLTLLHVRLVEFNLMYQQQYKLFAVLMHTKEEK